MQKAKAKKRNTFISIAISLLVLLLMLVTLSTSTYAWYSSINRARIHDITFTAAGNDSVAGNLAITWDYKDTGTAEIHFNTISTQLYPMIPKYNLTVGSSTFKEFKDNGFYYTYQKQNEDKIWVVGRDGIYTTPFVLNGTDNKQDYFYLVNLNNSKPQEITAYYSIEGMVAQQLKIALFSGDTADENDLILQAIMSNSDTIHYGELVEDMPVTSAEKMENAYLNSGKIKFNVDAGKYKILRLVAWLDGVTMTNEYSLNTSTFNIYFDGAEYEN